MKNTNKALFSSVVALILCCSMLIGSTFAWFTDSVTSSTNQIIAGNLDVDVLTADGKSIQGQKTLFDEIKLWEPGVVAYENLTVVNKGNLALKYELSINFANENNLGGRTLSEVLKVAVIPGGVDTALTREQLVASVSKWNDMASFIESSWLEAGAETVYGLVIYWLPNSAEVDNLYNANNGKTTSDGKPLSIDLGVNLVATQKNYEEDSFDENYDANLVPGVPAWDGTAGTVPAEVDGVITITTGAELAAFAASVNNGTTYSGKTVKLGADINLAGKSWTSIGDCESGKYFRGTFDGQGYTIYNLNVDYSTDVSKHATAGLFGWVDAAKATVKNVNIDGAIVKGSHWVGVIAGYFTGTIENCSVHNATVIGNNVNDEANGDKVGGIVGYLNEHSYLNNNTVTNSAISGNRDIGGIAGSVAASTYELKNNKVTNVTISFATSKDYGSAGEIVSGRTGYAPDDTNVVTNVKIVKSVIVSTADELAAALKSTDKNIVVTLANNIDVPITSLGQQTAGSGEYKLAGENTESIVIDLNSHKLNITTTYWSAIGAKNDDATITIKNGSMTSTGNSAGTWNAFDVRLCNCNYVIENVVFEKAVALDNAGKTTTMKNVTINETHDYYALWITAEGQNVEIDGLTINSAGRGIKIDEQYVGTPAKVTLKVSNADFNTVKKGAIMVKSAAGADITLSEIDITGAKMDKTNAVWVDSDATNYADKVTVTGGTKIDESDIVTDNSGLDAAIKDGETTIKLAGGTYIIPDSAQGKTLTIIGLGDTVIATQDDGSYEGCDYSLDGATVAFENIAINTDSHTYTGYARLNATYKNCTINGTYTLYGNSTFENCTFNVSGDVYNIWTWGAPEATFTGCTFNSDGKAMLLYGTANTKLTLNDCVFNDTGILPDLKAAIEIGNDYGKSYELVVNNTVVNGYEINDKGINTGTTLWGNKNGMSCEKLKVVIDGVAQVWDAAGLTEAIKNGGKIAFASDITVDKWIMFSETLSIGSGQIITLDEINLTIDGNGHTLTVNSIESAKNGDQLFHSASNLNISNLTIKYADGLATGGIGLKSGVISNVNFVGGTVAIQPLNGDIKIENCTFATNGTAIYFEQERDNLTVTGCTFNQPAGTNVILLHGDVKFTNNTINSGRTVNIVSGSPVVTGNNFNNVRLKVYSAATATISGNTINNLVFEDNATTYSSTFENNTLSTEAQAALNAVTKEN